MHESTENSTILSIISTLVMTLLAIAYSLTWGILFLFYIERKEYEIECVQFESWGRVLYFLLLIASGLHFISSVIKLVFTYFNFDSNIPNFIMMIKSCLSCITSIIILIGITTYYFTHENLHDQCKPLSKLILAYIISEFAIIGLFGVCIITVCLSSYFCNRKKYRYETEEDFSDEENEI
jgi:hypothetical protein